MIKNGVHLIKPKVRDDGTYVLKGGKESACDACHRKKEEHKMCKTFCKYRDATFIEYIVRQTIEIGKRWR